MQDRDKPRARSSGAATGDGDDGDRPQMADDDANASQGLGGGDITRNESVACHKTDQISGSHQCRYVLR